MATTAQNVFMGSDLDQLIERARLPVSLNVAARIFTELDSPASTLDDIADIISTDVSLCAKVLKNANSPLFMGGGVNTVTEALVYVGLDDIANLLAASEILQAFEDIPLHENPYRFWYENLYAATAGQVLARHVCLPEGRMFTASLLRGIGELMIQTCLPEQAKAIVEKQMQNGDALHFIEHEILGFNHAELGSALLEKWGMPDTLVLPIRHYLNPDLSHKYHLEAVVVHMANYLKNQFYEIPQPPVQNNLLHEKSDKNRQQLEKLMPEIERLYKDSVKLVMG